MRWDQIALLLVGQGLLLLTLVGLWKRQRLRRLWTLPAHLIATALVQVFELSQPEVFRVWRVWAARELGLHVVSLAIVAEVAWRAFANLPEARQRVRLILALALLIPLTLLVLTPWHIEPFSSAPWLFVLVAEVLPRLTYGAGFVCMALVWAMAKHLIPRDPLHASVVFGLGCYLFIYAVSLGLQTQGGSRALVYSFTPASYTLMLAFWTWIAWRHEPVPDAPEAVRRTLQPWRN